MMVLMHQFTGVVMVFRGGRLQSAFNAPSTSGPQSFSVRGRPISQSALSRRNTWQPFLKGPATAKGLAHIHFSLRFLFLFLFVSSKASSTHSASSSQLHGVEATIIARLEPCDPAILPNDCVRKQSLLWRSHFEKAGQLFLAAATWRCLSGLCS